MITVDDLLTLPGSTLDDVMAVTNAQSDQRTQVTGYQRLRDLEVIDAPGGERIFVRGDQVQLIYVGPDAVPVGLTSTSLSEAVGSDGELLRSRQGKRAELHVVASRGIAWSEVDDEIGFLELFEPTTIDAYQETIYLEPPHFAQ